MRRARPPSRRRPKRRGLAAQTAAEREKGPPEAPEAPEAGNSVGAAAVAGSSGGSVQRSQTASETGSPSSSSAAVTRDPDGLDPIRAGDRSVRRLGRLGGAFALRELDPSRSGATRRRRSPRTGALKGLKPPTGLRARRRDYHTCPGSMLRPEHPAGPRGVTPCRMGYPYIASPTRRTTARSAAQHKLVT